MDTEQFLAAMSQDLTISQLEDCGIVEFINTGKYGVLVRPLVDTLPKIIDNLNNFIKNPNLLVVNAEFGICFNYAEIFRKEKRNFDFYSLNKYFCCAIIGVDSDSLSPIPIINWKLWDGESLKNRIIYMQWVVRQLTRLKNHLGVE